MGSGGLAASESVDLLRMPHLDDAGNLTRKINQNGEHGYYYDAKIDYVPSIAMACWWLSLITLPNGERIRKRVYRGTEVITTFYINADYEIRE